MLLLCNGLPTVYHMPHPTQASCLVSSGYGVSILADLILLESSQTIAVGKRRIQSDESFPAYWE